MNNQPSVIPNLAQSLIDNQMIFLRDIDKQIFYAESQQFDTDRVVKSYKKKRDAICLEIGRLYAHLNSEVF
jgi:hypothetical protein